MSNTTGHITVIGLGYVGLPLAAALAKHFPTTGFDIDRRRVSELEEGHDRTGEIDAERMATSTLALTCDTTACPPSAFYIVTVPTPITADNKPDLSIVEAATRTVAGMVRSTVEQGIRPIIVYESTVYPGVTEDICGPLLESETGQRCGEDFFLAYSPERINPGDREHTIDKITKVVSGQTPEVLEQVAELYNTVTSGGVFRAASIKAAEAAKVIENAQRDINIAFMNEIAQIFGKMDLSVWDVLEAANTKWNFLPFSPGLVGGHCIGVDPYYLSHRAEALGHDPKVILAGRDVNDGMPDWVADALHAKCGAQPRSVLVLGMTFKENVPDIRNSKVVDLVRSLNDLGHSITVHDPHADHEETHHEYGIVLDDGALSRRYGLVLLAVPHREYVSKGTAGLRELVEKDGMLADLKGVLPGADWSL